MSNLDFVILISTLLFISLYGVYKNYQHSSLKSYFLGDNKIKWGTIGLSVMATQATAITFLSTPGQGFASGMSFIQNYLGLPIALIVICIFFIPIYFRSKITTAYEYLEERFDLKVRILTSFLFLMQRGFQCGLTIYAPSIILVTILDWNLSITIVSVGLLVITYTVFGGSKAVSYTQKQQMGIILLGMIMVFYFLLSNLTQFASFNDSMKIAGIFEKTNAINFSFDLNERYTIWSGLFGGFFLALSYFGTDQSQVLRYINGKNVNESRMGLIFNAILKIPMQFFILLLGVLLFVFYQFNMPPIHFNKSLIQSYSSSNKTEITDYEINQKVLFENRKTLLSEYLINHDTKMRKMLEVEIKKVNELMENQKNELEKKIKNSGFEIKNPESDYVFISFILEYIPQGLIGFLIAVIFSAAMSSTSAEITALSSITTIDIYKRLINRNSNEDKYVYYSKIFSFMWGLIAILFALFLITTENLIQSINIVASLFYGNVLGIFLVAFFSKKIFSNCIFYSAILSQFIVLVLFTLSKYSILQISYLWFNVIGCSITIILSVLFYYFNEYIINSSK